MAIDRPMVLTESTLNQLVQDLNDMLVELEEGINENR